MKKTILAMDMGGSSVKARIYCEDKIKKETIWKHNYADEELKKSKKNLAINIKNFCDNETNHEKNNKINRPETQIILDAVGLGVAGLISTNNSLYSSTVLTSFTGFNIPDFLKQQLGVKIVTIDNDADCGAINEYIEKRKNLFYVVVGSGIGSAYVDEKGDLPYLTRIKPRHKISYCDNPIPNDLGLQVRIPKKYVYEVFKKYNIKKSEIEKIIADEIRNVTLKRKIKETAEDMNYVRAGSLGSATGLKKIAAILNIQNKDEPNIELAYEIFGHFLGYGIAEAQKIIRSEQKLDNFPDLCLSGPIMNSFEFFESPMKKTMSERGVKCHVELSNNFTYSNTHGAYLRALKALEQTKFANQNR